MIIYNIPTTEEYFNQTKQIKLGKERINPIFESFAQWMSASFNISVINIQVFPDRNNRQIVSVFVDSFNDIGLLSPWNYILDEIAYVEEEKARVLYLKLTEILTQTNPDLLEQLNKSEVQFCLYNFELYAKYEILDNANKNGVFTHIRKSFSDAKVAKIYFKEKNMMNIYFNTPRQLERVSQLQLLEKIADEFFLLIKPFDSFSYFEKKLWEITFISEEDSILRDPRGDEVLGYFGIEKTQN